jgi:hypothetical protein
MFENKKKIVNQKNKILINYISAMVIRSILKDPNKVNKYKSKKNIRFSKKNHIRIIPNKEDMKKEMIKGEKENKVTKKKRRFRTRRKPMIKCLND